METGFNVAADHEGGRGDRNPINRYSLHAKSYFRPCTLSTSVKLSFLHLVSHRRGYPLLHPATTTTSPSFLRPLRALEGKKKGRMEVRNRRRRLSLFPTHRGKKEKRTNKIKMSACVPPPFFSPLLAVAINLNRARNAVFLLLLRPYPPPRIGGDRKGGGRKDKGGPNGLHILLLLLLLLCSLSPRRP